MSQFQIATVYTLNFKHNQQPFSTDQCFLGLSVSPHSPQLLTNIVIELHSSTFEYIRHFVFEIYNCDWHHMTRLI